VEVQPRLEALALARIRCEGLDAAAAAFDATRNVSPWQRQLASAWRTCP
jgi:hypothetical protein